VAPCTSLRRVDVDVYHIYFVIGGGVHQDDMPAVAVEVVAGAAGGAEHRRFGVEAEPVIRVLELWQRQLRQVQLVA